MGMGGSDGKGSRSCSTPRHRVLVPTDVLNRRCGDAEGGGKRGGEEMEVMMMRGCSSLQTSEAPPGVSRANRSRTAPRSRLSTHPPSRRPVLAVRGWDSHHCSLGIVHQHQQRRWRQQQQQQHHPTNYITGAAVTHVQRAEPTTLHGVMTHGAWPGGWRWG